MIIEIILLMLGFLGLIIGAYSDIKIREVPDFISFLLIFTAILLRLINSIITGDWSLLLLGIIGLLIGSGIGFAMYYLGQWGGGDAKLIMGLFCIFATTPVFFQGNLFFEFPFSFLLVFFFNILFSGAIYSLIYSFVLLIMNFKKFSKEFSVQYKNNRKKFYYVYAVTFMLIFVSFFFEGILKLTFLIFGSILLIFSFLFLYVKSVEKSCFVKEYPIEKLREGDWIVEKIKIKNKTIYDPKELGISKEKIELLKKRNIKTVVVKEGVPFVPAFLIAFLLTYFIGNWLFMILM